MTQRNTIIFMIYVVLLFRKTFVYCDFIHPGVLSVSREWIVQHLVYKVLHYYNNIVIAVSSQSRTNVMIQHSIGPTHFLTGSEEKYSLKAF